MTAIALFLMLLGWLLVYAGLRNKSVRDELRAAFGR